MNSNFEDDVKRRINESVTAGSVLFGGANKQKKTEDLENISNIMVRGLTTNSAIEGSDDNTTVESELLLKSALTKSLERIKDSANTIQLLPDIKQVLEIMIGSILSPNDMQEPTLTYRSTIEAFNDDSGIPLLNYIKNYFSSSYKLEDKLEDILWDILGYTGSYPTAILPETTVDYMINSNSRVTMEELRTGSFERTGELAHIGFIGNGAAVSGNTSSMENGNILEFFKGAIGPALSYDKAISVEGLKGNVTVIDNFDILKLPDLKRKISSQAVHEIIASRRELTNSEAAKQLRANASFEAIKADDYTKSSSEIQELNKLYPDREFRYQPVLRVSTTNVHENGGAGHPRLIKIPTESVIPVFNPMDPRVHVGYYVMIDPTGFAVRFTDVENLYKMLQTNSNAVSGSSVATHLLQQAAAASNPNGVNPNGPISESVAIAQAVPIFQTEVERDLLNRLSNGKVGPGYKVADLENATLLMLSRALMNKQTQLLFIPAEMFSYMAVDYDNFGLGKTLLDDSKVLAALRALNQMVNSIASSKNAITKRAVNLKLPPTEKNPEKAVRMLMNEFIKGTHGEYPLTNSPVDQINYIQRAGIQVRVEDHPRYPNSELSVDYIDNQYKEISVDYDNWLKDQHIRSFGFSPELINGANGTDFAIQTVFANVMTSRRIRALGNKFTPNLSDFVKKYTYNSATLYEGLIELVKANKIRFKRGDGQLMDDKDTVALFIDSIEIVLPTPDTSKMEDQKKALDVADDFYTKAIEQFFNSEMFTEETLGELGIQGNIDAHKAYIKSYYLREWMKKNGIANELFDMLSVDKSGKPMIDFEEKYADWMDGVAKSILPFMKRQLMRKGNIEKHMERFTESLPNKPTETDGGFGGGGDDFGGGDGDFGGDGFDDDTSSEDTNLDESTDDGLGDPMTDASEGDSDETTDDNGKDNIV